MRALAALAAVACSATLGAEPMYVTEQLVVNVMSAAEGGERIAILKSGERVELLEKSGELAHVRLASGKDGWLRASYLMAQEPLRLQLAQRDGELAQLKQQLAELEERLRSASAAASAPPRAATAPAGAEPPPAASPPLFSAAEAAPGPRLWPWLLTAGLAGLGFGFALGALLLDRHIRRKYGGLRIY